VDVKIRCRENLDQYQAHDNQGMGLAFAPSVETRELQNLQHCLSKLPYMAIRKNLLAVVISLGSWIYFCLVEQGDSFIDQYEDNPPCPLVWRRALSLTRLEM
jgi:hypothetical protein